MGWGVARSKPGGACWAYFSSSRLPGHASSWWKGSASESGTGRHLCKEKGTQFGAMVMQLQGEGDGTHWSQEEGASLGWTEVS